MREMTDSGLVRRHSVAARPSSTRRSWSVDQGSQVFSKALLDAAQVLTPEQRKTLAKFVQEHHGGRHHF